MESRSIVALGALMLVVGAGLAFYWYEYRPSRIRAACETYATEQAQAFLRQMMGKNASKGLPTGLLEGMYSEANKENYYISCVRKQGLER
jgi:hypothetical protein